MKLYSREFLRALRRDARIRIKSSKTLRREHRLRRRRIGRISVRPVVFYPLCIAAALSIIFGASADKPDLPFIVIALYSTGTVVLRSRTLFNRLHGPGELRIFFGLPISDDAFFRMQWKKFLLRSVWFFVFTFLLYFLDALQAPGRLPLQIAIGALAALAQWAVVVALVAMIVNLRHPWMSWSALALYGIAVVGAFAPPALSHTLFAFTAFLPAGWINVACIGMLNGNASALFWLAPAAVIVSVSFWKVERLRREYAPELLVYAGLAETSSPDEAQIPEVETEGSPETEQEPPESLAGAAAPDATVTGSASLTLDWNAFWLIERVVGRWLTKEEKSIADFLLAGRLGQWSSGWGKAFYFTIAIIVCALLIPGLPPWLMIGAAMIAALLAAPVLGGEWPGLSRTMISMKQSCVVAFYPVTYWQASRVMLKINIVRLLAYVVLLFPTILALSWRYAAAWRHGISMATGIWVWLVVLQLGAVAVQHSQGTNDTRTHNGATIMFFLFVVLLIIVVLVGIFVLFIPDAPVGGVVSAVIAAPFLLFAWWMYGLLYNRGRIDLMREPER
ncbi:MAG TPA: hypothetical protein VN669_06760 [Candidatus Acidoferrales bacterium]|nr:hypothetical protein [Candidatus Acidoferrales bacterium]